MKRFLKLLAITLCFIFVLTACKSTPNNTNSDDENQYLAGVFDDEDGVMNKSLVDVEGNILSVRRLYRSQKMVILQAMNPKYQTIALNIFSEDMILGKVECMSREIR